MTTPRKFMAGLSLIELMIAITIALVAILAATQLYSSTRQTYRVQTMQNRLAEDGRFAISMLQRVIAQAGFRPTPTTVWGGFGTGNASVTATSVAAMTVRFIADGASQIGCDGQLLGAGAATELEISSASKQLRCAMPGQSGDDMSKWIASAGAGTELMDFRLGYGVDISPETAEIFGCGPSATAGYRAGDCVADDYWPSASHPGLPTALDRIVAVRACLVLRSDTMDISIVKDKPWQDCSGGAIADSQNDNRLYRTFRTTVLLRNR